MIDLLVRIDGMRCTIKQKNLVKLDRRNKQLKAKNENSWSKQTNERGHGHAHIFRMCYANYKTRSVLYW